MSRITVTLGTKTKQAESIVEPLLSDDNSLIDRAKAELYHECVDRNIVNSTFKLYSSIPFPGDIISINEESLALLYLGVVTSFSIGLTNDDVVLQNTIERPIL